MITDTANLVTHWKSHRGVFQHDLRLWCFKDFFENVVVGFPSPPGWVNGEDDFFKPTDELFVKQDCFHLFCDLARRTTVCPAPHGTYM